TKITGPQIGPGAAAVLALASGLAGIAGGIRRRIEIAKVTAEAVDAELQRVVAALARLRHAGALDARDAAGVFRPRRHLGLEPADRVLPRRARIVEAPRAAARLAIATRRAGGRIGRALDHAGVIAARAIEASLAGGRQRRGAQRNPPRPHRPGAKDEAPHHGP